MSKARALALPYAISKLLRQRSPHPVAGQVCWMTMLLNGWGRRTAGSD